MPKGDNFKGQKHPDSGRKKGTVNKTTVALRDALGGEMHKAVVRLLHIANTSTDEATVIRATDIALPYFYPKLSAIQIDQDKQEQETTINVRFIEPPKFDDAD